MTTYNELITAYIKVDDTAVKNIIIDLFVDSDFNSLPKFIECIVAKCGLTSMNVMVVHGDKWDVYMGFSADNIFSQKKGILELAKAPVSKDKAEQLLAKKLMELLNTVDFYDFKERI